MGSRHSCTAPTSMWNRSPRALSTDPSELDPRTYNVYTIYQSGARRTDPTRVKQGPSNRAHICSRFASPPPAPQMVSHPKPHPPRFKSANSHRDRALSGSFLTPQSRHPRNCRRFLLLAGSLRRESTNSHRELGGPDRGPHNCHRF